MFNFVFIVMYENVIVKVFDNWKATQDYLYEFDWSQVIIQQVYED